MHSTQYTVYRNEGAEERIAKNRWAENKEEVVVIQEHQNTYDTEFEVNNIEILDAKADIIRGLSKSESTDTVNREPLPNF